jgi:hypothetical protein
MDIEILGDPPNLHLLMMDLDHFKMKTISTVIPQGPGDSGFCRILKTSFASECKMHAWGEEFAVHASRLQR